MTHPMYSVSRSHFSQGAAPGPPISSLQPQRAPERLRAVPRAEKRIERLSARSVSELSTPARDPDVGREAPPPRAALEALPVDIPGNSPSLGGEIHPCYEPCFLSLHVVQIHAKSFSTRTSTAALRDLGVLDGSPWGRCGGGQSCTSVAS